MEQKIMVTVLACTSGVFLAIGVSGLLPPLYFGGSVTTGILALCVAIIK